MVPQRVQVIHTIFQQTSQHCQKLFENQQSGYSYSDLQFVALFNVLFQYAESENNTGSLLSTFKIHILPIQRPKQSDID